MLVLHANTPEAGKGVIPAVDNQKKKISDDLNS